MRVPSPHFSLCEGCGQAAVHAASCPVCGRSCCRWQCYARHLGRHQGGRGRNGAVAAMPEVTPQEANQAAGNREERISLPFIRKGKDTLSEDPARRTHLRETTESREGRLECG
jgi:hypothetical protein